jgi:hypothetical protein
VPTTAATVAEGKPEAGATRAWQRPTAWVTAAAATAAAGVFAVELVIRERRAKEFNANQSCGGGAGGDDCRQLAQRANDAGKWALVSGVTAGVLGAGAAVLFLTLPESPTQVSLQASPSHLGLRLQGRF